RRGSARRTRRARACPGWASSATGSTRRTTCPIRSGRRQADRRRRAPIPWRGLRAKGTRCIGCPTGCQRRRHGEASVWSTRKRVFTSLTGDQKLVARDGVAPDGGRVVQRVLEVRHRWGSELLDSLVFAESARASIGERPSSFVVPELEGWELVA